MFSFRSVTQPQPSSTVHDFDSRNMVSQTAKPTIAETVGITLGTEENSKMYKLLLNKRSQLASKYDCMPYMVASNEALMKMALAKPSSVTALTHLKRKLINPSLC